MSGGRIAQIQALFGRDPKRSWLLAILVAVMAGMWGRLVFSGPHLGIAAAPNMAPAASISATESVHQSRRLSAGQSLSDWARQTSQKLDRNLFAVPFGDYPADPAHPPESAQKNGELAKSPSSQADQLKERQKLVETLQAQAANLTLESTMPGAHPRAWVNGLLVGVGEPIGQTGFSVAKVETRRIFIERNGVQIELSMK